MKDISYIWFSVGINHSNPYIYIYTHSTTVLCDMCCIKSRIEFQVEHVMSGTDFRNFPLEQEGRFLVSISIYLEFNTEQKWL